MLRTLKYPHTLCRVHGWQVTTAAAGTAVLDIGAQEATVTRTAAGKATATLLERAGSGGVVFATPGVNCVQGGFVDYDTILTGLNPIVETREMDGTGDDGTAHALVGVVEETGMASHRCYPSQSVKGVCVAPRMLCFRVSAAGALSFGKSQATCSKAASVYTVTFTTPFDRTPVAVATPVAAAAKAVRITAISATAVSVETYDPVGAALEDNIFDLVVLGWDSPDIMAGMRRSIKVPYPLPRVEFYAIDGDAGPAVLSGGTSDGALTVNGAGDYTITFTDSFARVPLVLVCGRDYRAQQLAAATTTTCRVGAFGLSGGGHAAIDDHLYVAVIGSDDDTDY